MDANVINELKSGLSAAYINGSSAANLAYKRHLYTNKSGRRGRRLFHPLEDEHVSAAKNFRSALHLSRWAV